MYERNPFSYNKAKFQANLIEDLLVSPEDLCRVLEAVNWTMVRLLICEHTSKGYIRVRCIYK
ncbi:hypothetical protein Tter_0292 [Thermobaculum terrenum ATCC BAA-798]|uniref:Uncharacterized protein n=1 Tax=Thermobaculum terrenum (strain ATCC BAA-798 / CCMEE 7001 / YNP1) TaxID=525904 RepID=D1CE58_THET1|nr:hypothetical protein Tter_0292 [Thermobaculum terrenum ATCC BAA-798]